MATSRSPILLTGAAGFVGQALMGVLREECAERRVVCVDRIPQPLGSVQCDAWHVLDLGDAKVAREVIADERPAAVFHVAGLARGTDWDALYHANVVTTLTLLGAIQELSLDCVIVIPGSAAEYGPVDSDRLPVAETTPLRPISPYGVSKAWQTLAALSFVAQGLDVRIGRLFNIIGPGLPQSFALGAFAHQLREVRDRRRGPVLKTGYLGSDRDFLDVRDVARALVAIADSGSAGEVYNVCSGVGLSMQQCLDILIEVSGLHVSVESESANDSAAILSSVGSNAKLTELIGWSPHIALRQSIADLWTEC